MKNSNLEIVRALMREMNEELKGGQKNLDVAKPFGKITRADFDALRGMKKEDLMSTLGGDRPYGDKEMREKIVEPNLGKNYDTYIMFRGPKGQYDQVKNKYVKDIENWKPLYRSSNYQGNASLSPDGNVIKATILDQGGVVGAIYVKKQGEISEDHEGRDHEVSMANNSLDSILWAVGELKKHLGDQERDIPAWIQDHITNAENFITQAAKNFHDYGQEEQGETPEAEYGDEEAQDMSLSSLMEAKKKPSAGLSKKQKSAIVKKAKKGGDIGKKGKGFEKVAAAAKKGGAKNPQAVAAAAMWKGAAKRAK